MYVVYELLDGPNGTRKFVGGTDQPLKSALAEHVRSAKEGGNDRASRWIRQLLAAGRRPRVAQVLAVDHLEVCQAAVAAWVAFLRRMGFDAAAIPTTAPRQRGARSTR